MEKIKLPEGYQTVMPYLILNDAMSFFDFTKNVFGAIEKAKHLNEDGSLMHGEVMIGGSTLMFGNASAQWHVQNSGLYINVADADEVFQKALENRATVYQPMVDQGYGRSGGIKDPFGNTWWITTPV